VEYLPIILGALCAVLLIVVIALLLRKQKGDYGTEIRQLNDKIVAVSENMAREFYQNRIETNENARSQREESNRSLAIMNTKLEQMSKENLQSRIDLLETVSKQLKIIRDENTEQNARQTKIIEESIGKMQESNEKKLDEMRTTVDEKLTSTLNDRLTSSFKTVSEQLQNVYKSLGEMKELSAGVTDNVKGLNRVLTNVKSRGTWAEVQLGNILDQTIPGMYETNVKTNPKYNGQVEFAVKIPSADSTDITWLPIDSKFPMEDYARLSAAAESGDTEAVEAAKKALESVVKSEADLIKNYISVPETTPFAIMYLATEGLYAEILSSKSGIAEKIKDMGIMIAGPSTVTALLNSLQMGFRSIAINEKANEVFKVLGAAKTQYEKFGEQLARAKKNVEAAGKALDEADHRNEIIKKSLKTIETLDSAQSGEILGIEE
jgi:DNA recombination protein RmuC